MHSYIHICPYVRALKSPFRMYAMIIFTWILEIHFNTVMSFLNQLIKQKYQIVKIPWKFLESITLYVVSYIKLPCMINVTGDDR